jgi:hypothetical protein
VTAGLDVQGQLARAGIVHAAEMAARQRDEARRGELQDLAGLITSGAEEPPAPEDIRALVAGLAHPSLPSEVVEKAWAALAVAMKQHAEIDALGSDTPGVSKEELLDWLEGDREAALNVLVNGTGGNR